jgi:hypothetical protein
MSRSPAEKSKRGEGEGEPRERIESMATMRAKHTKHIKFIVTVEELRLLASLASDQLFRRQFIDPRMPGYKGSREEVDLGKALVGRMRLIIDDGAGHTTSALALKPPLKNG